MRVTNDRSQVTIVGALVVWALLTFTMIGYGQDDSRSESHRWLEGDFADGEMERAAFQKSSWAMSGLERVFGKESDPWKRFVASAALVELGSNDQQHWDYMEKVTRQAMVYRGPNPLRRLDSGRVVEGGLSDDFVAWCEARDLNPLEYYGQVIMFAQGRVFQKLMAWQDRRLIPLLREALQSNNPYVVSAAGIGLGSRGDYQGLDLIVSRYRSLGLYTDAHTGNLSMVLSRLKQSEIRAIPGQWRQQHKDALEQAEQSRPDAYRLQ